MIFLHQDLRLLVVLGVGLQEIPLKWEGGKGGKRQSKDGERHRAGYKERLRLQVSEHVKIVFPGILYNFTGTKPMLFSNSSSSTTLRLLWTLMHL